MERVSSLAQALMEPDDAQSLKYLKKAARAGKEHGQNTLFEIKQLNSLIGLALGSDLTHFLPEYFKHGVIPLLPGCCSSYQDQLRPWDERPLLRIVGDREKSQNAMQTFLCSRLRALELSDPHHILWRVAQLGIEHAGFKNHVAALTVTANAWKGYFTLLRCSVCLCFGVVRRV